MLTPSARTGSPRSLAGSTHEAVASVSAVIRSPPTITVRRTPAAPRPASAASAGTTRRRRRGRSRLPSPLRADHSAGGPASVAPPRSGHRPAAAVSGQKSCPDGAVVRDASSAARSGRTPRRSAPSPVEAVGMPPCATTAALGVPVDRRCRSLDGIVGSGSPYQVRRRPRCVATGSTGRPSARAWASTLSPREQRGARRSSSARRSRSAAPPGVERTNAAPRFMAASIATATWGRAPPGWARAARPSPGRAARGRAGLALPFSRRR